MSTQKTDSLKYIISTVKSSFLPALLFCAALIIFYARQPYETNFSFSLHCFFYAVAGCGMLLLCAINQSKPFYSLLTGTCCYMLLNVLKIQNPEKYLTSPEYLWLCFLLPLNLTFLYFLPQGKLRRSFSTCIFLLLLTQMALVQHFGNIITTFPYLNLNFGGMPFSASVVWFLVFLPVFLDISTKNTILNTGLFYGDSCLFLGLVYSTDASGLTTFFSGFALILFCTTVLDLYRRYNYDSLEYVGSYNAYLNHAASSFPYKYTIVLFRLDNREKLLQELGRNKTQEVEQMIINRIREFPQDISFYRYIVPEELIMVFKNEDGKHTKEYAENIRHTIAATDFVLTGGKTVKLTISGCYSEKTRIDLKNVANVLRRAHDTLPKLLTSNVIIPAQSALPEAPALEDTHR